MYIDQIGSAVPKLCWDSQHQHTLGGGDFWRQGYLEMMETIFAGLQTSTVLESPIVTEDNAEPYMDMMQVGILSCGEMS